MKKQQHTTQHLNIRLGIQFDDFRHSNQFTDCLLISGETRFPCQRIVLAKISKWFDKYFEEHPITKYGDICEIDLPVNPNNVLDQFLNLIYTNYADVNINNLPLLLKMSVFYDCPIITKALQNLYHDATNDETVLHLAKEFIALDLIDDARSLAPHIAHHLKKIHNGEADLRYTIEDLFKSLSPSVFAAVINQDLLKQASENEKQFTDEDKVRYIDNFVLYHGKEITDEKEKEDLASPIDWNSPIAFQYLARHQCDWLPARIARPLISRILKNRQTLQRYLEKSIKKSAPEVSRWYIYSWAQSCRNASYERDDPEVNVVQFIRTLGGTTNPIDPVKYGFMNSFCTPCDEKTLEGIPIAPDFGPTNVLLTDDQKYFMAIKKDGVYPGVGIDLGELARFTPHRIILNTKVPPRPWTSTRPSNPKPFAKNFCFKVGQTKEECIKSTSNYNYEISKEMQGKFQNQSMSGIKPLNAMMFQLTGPETNGGEIMRVVSLEVNGTFGCQ